MCCFRALSAVFSVSVPQNILQRRLTLFADDFHQAKAGDIHRLGVIALLPEKRPCLLQQGRLGLPVRHFQEIHQNHSTEIAQTDLARYLVKGLVVDGAVGVSRPPSLFAFAGVDIDGGQRLRPVKDEEGP